MSIDSSVKSVRVCEECATGYRIQDTGYKIQPPRTRGLNPASCIQHRECPRCHSRYSQIPAYAGMLGCPTCYNEFYEELKPLLRRIHGSTIYAGKSPSPSKVQGSKAQGFKRSLELLNPGTLKPSLTLRSFNLEDLLNAEWMQGTGPDCDVVVSTRVRLARNVSGHTFCSSAEKSELQQVSAMVENAVADLVARGTAKASAQLSNLSVIDLENLDTIDREFLIERHLISRDLAEKNGVAKVILGEKELVSIMLNEEDHIRLQVINPGLQPRQSWEMINAIDDELGREIKYAFSPDWGYLAACPTNVGTGLRVSVMLHIPALAATREGNRILSSISDMGYALRGIYGEGSQAMGSFYQISNQGTLGQSEEKIMDRIRSIARQIVSRERDERRLLVEKNRVKVEDKVFRSYGILTNARSISSGEALDLLSWVSLGVNTGILSNPSKIDIARLLVLTRPAHLQKYAGRKLDAATRDIHRAAVIRAILTGDKI